MSRLKENYSKDILPKLQEALGKKNILALPKLKRITVAVGLGDAIERKDQKIIETAKDTLFKITGQRSVETKAKKAIAGFKIRQGQVVGLKVTLRREKMYDFIDKLINVALPRKRDFKGISLSSVDNGGNLSIGFKEQTIFPEIDSQTIDKIHGLQITISTDAKNKEEGTKLFKTLGIPFNN